MGVGNAAAARVNEFHRGDFVFVHPDEPGAPREVRGLAGTVSDVTDESTTVVFHHEDNVFSFDVEASVLSRERRRRDREPADWRPNLATSP